MKGFLPLREEAEKRGKLIKVASDRHAPPDEACKLIGNFGQAESKMIEYVKTHAAKCGIPPQIADQLKTGHKNTENLQKKVCAAAQQAQQRGPAGPSLSEVLGSSAALPEATPTKKGGSTFDTLNGNVLARCPAARQRALLTRPATGSTRAHRPGHGLTCGSPVSIGRSDRGYC